MLAMFLGSALACGPDFPNSLLMSGDEAVLQAPVVRFAAELDRFQPVPPPGIGHRERMESARAATVAAEMFDLRSALIGRQLETSAIAAVVLAYSHVRADLEDHRRAVERARLERPETADGDATQPAPAPAPFVPGPLPEDVPREFLLYLRGAAAWHDGEYAAARDAWTAVLQLPERDRRFRSTWAAFMLGRSWQESDPARAAAWYSETRRLARAGFADSASLAVASLGWEAQIYFKAREFSEALFLYLDQYAAGSKRTSVTSLAAVARAVATAGKEERLAVARHPLLRRVVTAWIAADRQARAASEPSSGADASIPECWLETIEVLGVAEVPLAEELAVLAYQAGQWKTAARWVDLSGDSPEAEWIHAKLLLRDGHLQEAAEVMSRVVKRLPLQPPPAVPGEPAAFAGSLDASLDRVPARREVLGELGVLRLSRGDFEQALDALLRSGFWQDAAYLAERVLSAEALKAYVDREWPENTTPAAGTPSEDGDTTNPDLTEAGQFRKIRYLLARRLTRLNRGREAAGYYPGEWRHAHQRLMEWLREGEDPQRPNAERSEAWLKAAWLVRTNGLELLGTEVAPDWAIWDGNFEVGPTHAGRAALPAKLLLPTPGEQSRAATHAADPEKRFHYRYHAALLAWQAAALLPDDDASTARALYWGGSWLKDRDPETADIFYKALVRRCRGTELGAAADRRRWFPPLDADGRPIVTPSP